MNDDTEIEETEDSDDIEGTGGYPDNVIDEAIREVLEMAQGRLEEIGWEGVTTDWAEGEMPNNPAISFKVPGGYLDLNAVFRPD